METDGHVVVVEIIKNQVARIFTIVIIHKNQQSTAKRTFRCFLIAKTTDGTYAGFIYNPFNGNRQFIWKNIHKNPPNILNGMGKQFIEGLRMALTMENPNQKKMVELFPTPQHVWCII